MFATRLDPPAMPHITKLDFLVQQLQENEHSGLKSVVYSRYNDVLESIRGLLRAAGIPAFFNESLMQHPARQRVISQFQRHVRPAVLLINLQCSMQIINLSASRVYVCNGGLQTVGGEKGGQPRQLHWTERECQGYQADFSEHTGREYANI